LEERLKWLINDVPLELEAEGEVRDQCMRRIFRQLEGLSSTYRQLYEPVQMFLDQYGWVKEELRLEFGVSLEAEHFDDRFLGFINQGRRGAFQGVEDGRRRVLRMMQEVDFNSEEAIVQFVQNILAKLEEAQSGVSGQLRDSVKAYSLYDFLFALEYVQPRYTLNVGGRSLESLSPGERGMLLLVFYLLVDQGDIPLIIDQPEENLDNQSVFRLLVPCIKEVRKRRQIILVTHNPNLAVVCDAEQVVHAFMDKENNNRVTYTAGAIENPVINKKIVDVLEGTWPAFRNRSVKYDLFPDDVVSLQLWANLYPVASPRR
jgi:putative AbiEii toxin of type IV toxin-antitoxin system